MVTFDDVRSVALELPGVVESTSYGTPACKVGGKLLLRLREDGASIAVRIDLADKDVLLAEEGAVFFTTPHYDGYPMVLVRLEAIDREGLRGLLEGAWRFAAPPAIRRHADRQR
ncbi:MAG: MmcQ/YjbR family DNA-binding protein [Candidatus Dormiibacterota bacterium]